jgi:hypothetical protein
MNVNNIKKLLDSRERTIQLARTSEEREQLKVMSNELTQLFDQGSMEIQSGMVCVCKNKEYLITSKYRSSFEFEPNSKEYQELKIKVDILEKDIKTKQNQVSAEISDISVELALFGATPEITEKVKNLINGNLGVI